MAYIGSKPANKPVVASDLDPTVITGQTALATSPASTDEFLISDAGVLKRLDASLIGGANTPAFEARNASAQSVNGSTTTLMQFDTEVFDTNNTYTNSSTFKFTPGVAGKYFIYASIAFDDIDNAEGTLIYLYKNGASISLGGKAMLSVNYQGSGTNVNQTWMTAIVDSDADDYFQIYGRHHDGNANNTRTEYGNIFMAYKIIT